MNYLIIYLLIINALGLLLMLADKIKAIKNSRRIPEAVLLGLALSGGSLGCYVAMTVFRHKTNKPQFRSGLPAMLLLHIVIFAFLYRML